MKKFLKSLFFVAAVSVILSGISSLISEHRNSSNIEPTMTESVFVDGMETIDTLDTLDTLDTPDTLDNSSYVGDSLVEFPEESLLWGYSQLTPEEQAAYLSIRNAAGAYSTIPVPVSVSTDGLDRVLEALTNDHPEIFWFDGELTYYTSESTPNQVSLVELTYTVAEEDIPRLQAQIDTYIAGCMASAGMVTAESDFQKIVAVYRYLVDHTEYDISYTQQQSVVSLMQEGKAVCQGYAESFCLIMHRLGFPCAVIGGLSSQDWVLSDDGLAWNTVMLDGQWYNVDVTWGDPIPSEDGDATIPSDNYILVNDELFYRDHTDFNELGSPECTAMDYNYHYYYGLLHSEWNEGYFRWALQAQLNLGLPWAQVRYDNYEAYYTAKSVLLDNDLLGDIAMELGIGQDFGDHISWTYSCNDVSGTIFVKLIY